MTSDQDTKVVAEPQVQQVQEVKDGSHLVKLLVFQYLFCSVVPFSGVYFLSSTVQQLVEPTFVP
uniref:Uncharacterized protein n=1 Tax=Pavo cristatus TaxID=9049 RepID=A0A8C9EIU3_PAVCR